MLFSLRARMIASHLAIVLVVVLGLGTSSYLILKNYLTREKTANLEFIAAHVADMTGQRLLQLEDELERISTSKLVKNFHDTGRVVALGEYFSRFQSPFPEIGYLDERGWEEIRVVEGSRSLYLDDLHENELFRLAQAHPNKSLRGAVQVSERLGEPVLPIIHGLQRYFGDQFVGAVYALSPIKELTELYRHIEVGETGYLCLLERSGNILAYPDPSRIMTVLPADSRRQPFVADALNGVSGVAEGELLGVQGLIAYAPVKGLNATLMVILPQAEFDAAPDRLRNSILLNLAIVLVAGTLAALLLANRLTQPILTLTKAADKVSRGDFSADIVVSADGEIGALVTTFNQMLRELRNSTISRHYFNRILENMQEGLILLGLDGKIRTANRAACSLIGFSEVSLTGRGLDEFFNLASGTSEDWLEMLLADQGARTSQRTLKTRSGGDVQVEFSWSVLEGSGGQVQEVACLFQVSKNSSGST